MFGISLMWGRSFFADLQAAAMVTGTPGVLLSHTTD
jgi:hypothetical protein